MRKIYELITYYGNAEDAETIGLYYSKEEVKQAIITFLKNHLFLGRPQYNDVLRCCYNKMSIPEKYYENFSHKNFIELLNTFDYEIWKSCFYGAGLFVVEHEVDETALLQKLSSVNGLLNAILTTCAEDKYTKKNLLVWSWIKKAQLILKSIEEEIG